MSSVLNYINSMKKFKKTVEKKLFNLEKAMISQHTNPNNNIYNIGAGEESGKSDFLFGLFLKRIIYLKNEFSKKDVIIVHLITQSFTSKIITQKVKKYLRNDSDNDDTNKNRTSRDTTGARGINEKNNKRKVAVTGHSLLCWWYK